MKIALDHLPEQKQQELQWATQIIQEAITPEMVILFGSYARGDWVEDVDPETLNYRYQSDFDLLVVTETAPQATKVESNHALLDQLARRIPRTPISLIAEDIDFINRRLRKGQYFYIDIKQEGIVLYDAGRVELAEERELHPNERKKLAEEDFLFWFSKAEKQKKIFDFCFAEQDYNEAAFNLHQMTERLYGAILLVFTRYKPNTHDLKKLGQRVASVEPAFLPIFPCGTEEEKRRFELLRKAYTHARYKPSYTITQDELTWLAERVQQLQVLTEKRCKAKIAEFEQGASGG